MSEPAPTNFLGDAPLDGSPALTPETIEAVLADFRAWLGEVQASSLPAAVAGERPPVDLHSLVGQFAALKHEVNLQTRAARAQQEQNQEALQIVRQTFEKLEQTQSTAKESADEAMRPLLKALVDAYDALALADREVRRGGEDVFKALERLASAPARKSWLGGWFAPNAPEDQKSEQAAERARGLLASIATGYAMSLQRLERILQQVGLDPIACVGERFNPDEMEVLAAVTDSGRPGGEVVEEVRRGYRWRGRVFRYAQVSVAKQEPGPL